MYERESAIINAHQKMVAQIRERVTKYVQTQYLALGDWSDEAIEAFVAKVLPVVESGQVQVGQLTNAYLDALWTVQGNPGAPRPTEPVVWARNADPERVYGRPVKKARIEYSKSGSVEEAHKTALDRILSLVDIDMQLAESWTARSWMEGNRIVGYERVLSGAENCALCVLASTQRYHRADLKAIHRGCDCKVAPIFGDAPIGQVLNSDRYLQLQQGIRDQLGAQSYDGISNGDYRKVLVREHGEYGPVLSWRNQSFKGPSDVT